MKTIREVLLYIDLDLSGDTKHCQSSHSQTGNVSPPGIKRNSGKRHLQKYIKLDVLHIFSVFFQLKRAVTVCHNQRKEYLRRLLGLFWWILDPLLSLIKSLLHFQLLGKSQHNRNVYYKLITSFIKTNNVDNFLYYCTSWPRPASGLYTSFCLHIKSVSITLKTTANLLRTLRSHRGVLLTCVLVYRVLLRLLRRHLAERYSTNL